MYVEKGDRGNLGVQVIAETTPERLSRVKKKAKAAKVKQPPLVGYVLEFWKDAWVLRAKKGGALVDLFPGAALDQAEAFTRQKIGEFVSAGQPSSWQLREQRSGEYGEEATAPRSRDPKKSPG